MNKGYALLPGSYDPMTLGHLDVVRRASGIFERVFVALLINPQKKYTFSKEDRIKIATLTCAELSNVTVVYSDGYTADLASELGCSVIVKGIRNSADFEYEVPMAHSNSERVKGLETMFLPAKDELCDVSSTLVRELLSKGALAEAGKYLHSSVTSALISGEITYEID